MLPSYKRKRIRGGMEWDDGGKVYHFCLLL